MKHLVGLFLLGCHVTAYAEGVRTPLTFDDVTPLQYVLIPNGYGGLQWDNFFIANGSDVPFAAGAVSAPNVAINGLGDPSSISSLSPFTLQSAYFTAAYVEMQQIRAQGFAGGIQVYDNTYIGNSAAPTLVNFDYASIDQVRFTISSTPTGIFALDNLVVVVPEPSSAMLLLAGAVLSLGALARWKTWPTAK